MKIPVFFESLLHEGDDSLRGAVLKSVGDFEKWLEQRNLVFFPEYTDHGITHFESVLHSTEWLLSEAAGKVLGPVDAAVLLLAVVLHDCAMHLSKEGFLRLVDRKKAMWPVKKSRFLAEMQDVPWPDLWECFLREANRWDGQKRVDLFGEARSIRRPPEDAAWAEEDYLLIGEFLRRHHPRLAHEIAICGVPGPGNDYLSFTSLDNWLADLAGLVARSHGLGLRSIVERFSRPDRPDVRGVHATLLMSLLRIADYLDIDASRAPAELLKIRNLKSRISRREWGKHSAVLYIKIYPDDPEALWIDAEPEALEIFVGLQDLFAEIQRELDATWAVLGEVYGCDKHYTLRIRRIRSTLDDLDAFAERAAFVPVRARFDSAGGELLKLMVVPLYDDEPAYGVRELIQNAVDACREMKDVIDHQPALNLDRPELDADVVVIVQEEQDGQGWITVEDRGIGMSADVIVNYFLKAGASFRYSETWHERHDNRDGRPRVVRSGRFGLGVLATFLLGDEVHVTTRHVDDPRGIEFVAKLDEPHIELRWYDRPVGTTIRVRVTRPEVFDRLAYAKSWDWYRLLQPSVLRVVHLTKKREEHPSTIQSGERIKLDHGEIVPHGDDPPPAPWRRLQRPDFGEVLWSLLQRESVWSDVANGILLKSPDVVLGSWQVLWPELADGGWRPTLSPFDSRADFILFRPRVAVMEGASLFPVDLKRTHTVGRLPFHDDLVDAMCRDVLASLLVRAKERREDVLRQIPPGAARDERSFTSFATLWHPAVSTDRDEHGTKYPGEYRVSSWLFVTEKGLTLEDPSLETEHSRLGVAFIVVMERPSLETSVLDDEVLARAFRRIPTGFPVGTQLTLGFHDALEVHRLSGSYASAVIVVPTKLWQTKRGIHGYRRLRQSNSCNGWTIAWTGNDPSGLINLEELAHEAPEERDLAYVLFLLPEGYESQEPRNPLSKLWRDLFYHGEIPYDLALRKQLFAHAFDELREDIVLWTQLEFAEPVDKPVCARYWVRNYTKDENKKPVPLPSGSS